MADTPEVRMRFSAEGADSVAAAVRQLSNELQDLKKRQVETAESSLTLGKAIEGIVGIEAIRRLVEFGKEVGNNVIQIGRLSQETGVSVGVLSTLAVAGNKVGVSQDQIGTSILRLSKNIDALQTGSGKAATSFSKLGLSSKDFVGLNTDQKVLKVMNALGGLTSGTTKAAAAQLLFSRGGAALIPLLNELSEEGFGKLEDHAKELGKYLTGDTVASFMAAAASIQEVKEKSEGMMISFESGLVPALADAADELVRGTVGGGNGFQTMGAIVGSVVKFIVEGMETIGITIAAVVKDAEIDFAALWESIKAGGSSVWKSFADAASGNFAQAWQDIKSGWDTAKTLGADALEQSKQNWRDAAKQYAEMDKNLFDPATLAQHQKDRTKRFTDSFGGSGDDTGAGATDQSAQKARLAALRAALENELKLWKDNAKLKATADKNDYDEGLISLEEYFSRRRRAILEETAKEIETLQAERDLAAREPAKTDAERITNQQKVADLDAKITQARVQGAIQEKQLDGEVFQAREKSSKQVLEYEVQIAEAQGRSFDAAILKIKQESEEIRKALVQAGITPEQIQATIAALESAKTSSANYEQTKTIGGQAMGSFDIAKQGIENQAATGAITEYQAEQQILALERERLSGLQAIADAQLAAAKATGNQANILEAEQFKMQIDTLRASIESACDSWTKFKVGAQNALQSDLANWLSSGIDQANSLGDAFRSLALSAVNSIRQIAAQMIAQIAISKMIDLLKKATGKGGSGPASSPQDVATAAAAGMAQAGPLMMASGMMTGAGAIISSGAVELGVSAGELMAAASMLMAANSMSAGLGFASGGYVSGPGSSTSDSIPARLSDGEFVVRAAAVKAIGVRALAAINRGLRIPSIVSGFVPRFADGGLVQGTAGKTDGELRILLGLERGLILEHLASKDAGGVIVKQLGANAKAASRAIGKG